MEQYLEDIEKNLKETDAENISKKSRIAAAKDKIKMDLEQRKQNESEK